MLELNLLEQIRNAIDNENRRLLDSIALDEEIFNTSNSQCANDFYEYKTEKTFKSDIQQGLLLLGMELIIIGFYKQCELYIKALVEKNFPSKSKNEQKNLSNFNEKLEYYKSIDELRLINNAIKHQGVVSPELHKKYSEWIKDKPLGNLAADYERLKPSVLLYIEAHEMHLQRITEEQSFDQ